MWGPSGIPSVGVLTLPGDMVAIEDAVVTDARFQPTNAKAGWHTYSGGAVRKYTTMGGYVNVPGGWKLKGVASDYEIRFEHTDDDAPNGGSPLNTWLSMDQHRFVEFTNSDNFESLRQSEVTVKIRDVATSTLRDTAVITLHAIVSDTV
jgi:hypothetical protein